MAKGHFNGILRGKLGNSVFYKNTNSNNKDTQGSRAYVATIANPRTQAQASQRMRMKPAVNFCRGLADLLDHSFEGVKYGGRSRAKFMSLALLPSVSTIPFVDKGENRFIPGKYPLSVGSVGVNTNDLLFDTVATSEDHTNTFSILPLVGWDPADAGATFGDYSKSLIAAWPGLRDGDEITAVAVFENNGYFLPVHHYFVVDTASLARRIDVCQAAGLNIDADGSVNFPNATEPNTVDSTRYTGKCVAAGVIVSRHPTRTSTTWQRSSSTMQVSADFAAQWMSDARYAEAVATYRDRAVDLTSDWLLNQGTNQSTEADLNPGTRYSVRNIEKTIGGVTASMACLKVDSADALPVLYQTAIGWYYGTVAGTLVTFKKANQLQSNPASGTYYTTEQLLAASSYYSIDKTELADEPPIEYPE